MRSKSPRLIDTATGSIFQRWDLGDAKMMTEIKQSPYEQGQGAAFVTLVEGIEAHVVDEAWQLVAGSLILLPGGSELDSDDAELEKIRKDIGECDEGWTDAANRRPDLFGINTKTDDDEERLSPMMPMFLNDADLPPVQVLVRFDDLKRCQKIGVGDGPHARGTADGRDKTTICTHPAQELMMRKCRGCLRRMWMKVAIAKGLING